MDYSLPFSLLSSSILLSLYTLEIIASHRKYFHSKTKQNLNNWTLSSSSFLLSLPRSFLIINYSFIWTRPTDHEIHFSPTFLLIDGKVFLIAPLFQIQVNFSRQFGSLFVFLLVTSRFTLLCHFCRYFESIIKTHWEYQEHYSSAKSLRVQKKAVEKICVMALIFSFQHSSTEFWSLWLFFRLLFCCGDFDHFSC